MLEEVKQTQQGREREIELETAIKIELDYFGLSDIFVKLLITSPKPSPIQEYCICKPQSKAVRMFCLKP